MGCHLGVRDRHPAEVGADRPLGVAVGGIDRDPEPGRRLRPLELKVLRGRDDRDRHHFAAVEQFAGNGEGISRLARAGRRDNQEVALVRLEVLRVRMLLPATEAR
jgi:hypothetical protein